jgi:AraC-like DNA-binding protein
MLGSRILSFADPYPYQAALQGVGVEVLVTTGGEFEAELIQIELPRVRMQRGRERLSRILRGAATPSHAAISFLTAAGQPPMHHCGTVVSPGDIVLNDSHPMHCWTGAPCRWGSISLALGDLCAAAKAIAGRELTVPSLAHVVRPSAPHMSRLLALHEQAEQFARTEPDKFANAEAARAFDQALTHAMIICLTDESPVELHVGTNGHSAVMARLEEFLAERHDQPVYLAEICTATGASERTLRVCCHEYLGMGAIRYLWLRRMHLAHRALILAAPTTASVTRIATDCGFWELGRIPSAVRRAAVSIAAPAAKRAADIKQREAGNLHSVRNKYPGW